MRTMKRFMTEVLAALLICSMVVALQPAYAADQEVEGLQEVAVTAEADSAEVQVFDASNRAERTPDVIKAKSDMEPIVANDGDVYTIKPGYIYTESQSLKPKDANLYAFTATHSSMIVSVSNSVINNIEQIGVGLYDGSKYMMEQQNQYDNVIPLDYNTWDYFRYDGLTVGKTYYAVIYNPEEGGYTSGTAVIRVSPTSIAAYTTSITNRVYNGKASLPTTKLYYKDKTSILESGEAYTRSGTRTTVGSKTLTITAKAPFTGKVTKKYKVIPKKPTISVTKSGWYAKGSTKYFKLKWSKVSSQASGYQIQYASNSSFKSPKSVTVKSYKTTSKTIKAGKAKYYFFRIRTYKTVSGVKYYSNWSNIVSNKRVF